MVYRAPKNYPFPISIDIEERCPACQVRIAQAHRVYPDRDYITCTNPRCRARRELAPDWKLIAMSVPDLYRHEEAHKRGTDYGPGRKKKGERADDYHDQLGKDDDTDS